VCPLGIDFSVQFTVSAKSIKLPKFPQLNVNERSPVTQPATVQATACVFG